MGAEEAWRLSRICLEEFLSYFFTFLLILTVASRSFDVLIWNKRLKTGATFILDSFFVFPPRRVDWIRGNSRCPLVFSVLEATFQVETAAHAGVGWGGLHSSSHLTCGWWYEPKECHVRFRAVDTRGRWPWTRRSSWFAGCSRSIPWWLRPEIHLTKIF